ncbi:MAG: hypothetical protein ABIP88_11805 [Candidatus Binatia bacterium]
MKELPIIRSALIATLLGIALTFAIVPFVQAQAPATQSFRELLDRSEKERKGLMFYVKGQTIGGVVVKINTDSVDVRNQIYNRIVIRLDNIDAVAIN